MKKQILKASLAGLFLLTQHVHAQTYELQFNEAVKDKVRSEEFIGTDPSGNIYVSGYRPKLKMYLPLMVFNWVDVDVKKYIRKYDAQLQLVDNKEILSENPLIRQGQINGKVSARSFLFFLTMKEHNIDMPSFMLDGKYYMIAQENKAPRNNYYVLNVDRESGGVGQMTHVMALSKNKNDDERTVKDFSVSFSPDSSLILFLATYQKDKSEKSGVAYSTAVFTRDMKPVFSSAYTLPKASKTFQIKEARLTNSGEVLIVGRNYDKRQHTGYVSVFSITKDAVKPKESRLKFGTDHVNDVLLSVNNNNRPLVTGFYRNKQNKYAYDGIFYAALNEQKELYDVRKEEFKAEFVTSTYSAKSAKKAAKKEKKGKDVSEDKDFAFSEFIKTEDGGYVAIAENYDVVQYTRTTNGKAGISTHIEFHHYYNDIMVFKFDKDARLQAMNKIAKRKTYISGSSDKIYERDYTSFNHDGDVFVVFNDDPGQNDNKRSGGDSYRSDATYIACVKPDGTLKRDLLIGNEQLGKFTFDPHKKLQKLGNNKMAFIATKGAGRGKKSIMGSFTIHKEQGVVAK